MRITILYHRICLKTKKPFVLLKLPFCEENELKSKDFIKKFQIINKNLRLAISQKTRKIKSPFRIKDKNLYPACKKYYGECEQCGDNYISETVRRNTVTRWWGHNNPDHKSEPAEHIKRNIDHIFKWKILGPTPSQKNLMKNLEAIFIALQKLSPNDQKPFDRLMLFRNSITWF